MTNILLFAILLVNCVVFIIAAAVFLRVVKVIRGWKAVATEFVTPPAEGQASPLAKIVESSGDMIARSIVAQAKGFFMGLTSGQARAEKTIQGDIAEGMVEQAGLGPVLNSFPGIKRSLRRNPSMIDVVLPLVSRFLGGRPPGGNGATPAPADQQVRFKL